MPSPSAESAPPGAPAWLPGLLEDGFALVPDAVSPDRVAALLAALDAPVESDGVRRRENVYAIRNLLQAVPAVRDLCGLALGRASRHRAGGVRHTFTLTHVERRPEPPPVPLRGRIIPLSVAVARSYGLAVGATRLRLEYPDRNLLRYYELLGFNVAWKGEKPVY